MRASRLRGRAGAITGRLRYAAECGVDFLLGRACAGCGGVLAPRTWICADCDARVPRTGIVLCLRCMQESGLAGGVRPEAGRAAGGSGGCAKHGAERLLLAGPPFESPLDRIVRAFKYAGARRSLDWLASLLPEPSGLDAPAHREYVLVPVPAHPARRVQRGYDQVQLLADAAGATWGIPVIRALERRRDTPPQATLAAGARRDNVRDAFALAPRAARFVRGRAVLLLDDVATTGSTLLEAAAPLEGASPGWILGLTVAHGGLPDAPEPATQARVAAIRSV